MMTSRIVPVILLLLILSALTTIVRCSSSSNEDDATVLYDNDDDSNGRSTNAFDDDDDEDDSQHLWPYTVDVGVPQNLNMDDYDDDGKEFSLQEMRDTMKETEDYFQTHVLHVLSPEQVERCKDYKEECVVWALQGECSNNEDSMERHCAASCQVCHVVLPDEERCYHVENGPDIWNEGDLDRMFRRIIDDFQRNKPESPLEILSSPESTTYTTDEDEVLPGPWIIVIDNFLNTTEAERLIELGAEEGYRHSTIHATGIEDSYRTSSNSWCYRESCGQDPVAKNVLQRIYDMTEIPQDYSEDMQMLHYQPGQL
jgi:ShK domain-like